MLYVLAYSYMHIYCDMSDRIEEEEGVAYDEYYGGGVGGGGDEAGGAEDYNYDEEAYVLLLLYQIAMYICIAYFCVIVDSVFYNCCATWLY